MPYIEHTGVSRRIESDEERDRLKGILDELRDEGVGVIARTAAEGQGQKTLKADYGILVKLWKELSKSFKKIKAPNLCYQDLPFVHRVLRDITDENVEKILIDDKDSIKSVEKFASKYLPNLKGKTEHYTGKFLFLKKVVWTWNWKEE